MSARGFTLLELMVGGALGVFAITLVLGVFISQNASFQSLDLVRQMNANGRDASLELENSLKRAGYGIDPNVAFEFACPGQPAGTKCHDSYNGTDDLRFYARNPNYVYTPQGIGTCVTVGGCLGGGTMWQLTAAVLGGSTITATATMLTGDTLRRGQTVLLICKDSSNPIYGKITNQILNGPGAIAATIAVNTSTANTSLVANTALAACNSTGFMLLIDQYHYFVTTLTANGVSEPWLVLDTGIDYNGDGTYPPADTADLIPVARDVEDFQVAYLLGVPFVSPLPTAPDSNTDWIIGNNQASATQEEPNPGATLTQNGAANGSMHPGNIRGVRISMVLRSYIADRSLGTSFLGDPALKLENRSDVSGITLGSYRRMPITLSIATRNMGSANPYLFF